MHKNFKKQKKNTMYFYIKQMVHTKNWPIEDAFGGNFVEKFYKRLINFSESQQHLILKLTNNFLWIQGKDYVKEFVEVLKTKFIVDISFTHYNKIIICPLLKEKDFDRQKSSTYLLYEVRCCKTRIEELLKDNDILSTIDFIDRPNFLQGVSCKDTLLILLDDFIGTGDTALEAISYISQYGWNKKNILIMCLVTLKMGLNNLQSQGYKVIFNHCCNRGISDYSHTQDDIDEMVKIEEKLQVDEQCRFGYKQSEGLVSLINIPNNTFPIYWWSSDKFSKPPFCRSNSKK